MKKRVWLHEIARDIVALGGLPFFVLVLARVWSLDNVMYFLQFAVAGIVVGLMFLSLRQNVHAGLGLIVLVFTSLYYGKILYTVIGSVVYLLLLISLVYLGRDWKKVGLGFLSGILGIGVSFIYP